MPLSRSPNTLELLASPFNSIMYGMMSMSPPGMEAVSSNLKVTKVLWVNRCCLLVLDLQGSRKESVSKELSSFV
jgi:hypothetical protein